MHFLQPNLLYWAPLAVAGILIAVIARARQKQMINAWGNTDNIGLFARPLSDFLYWLKGIALTSAGLAAIVALSRPAVNDERLEFPAGSLDLVVLLDVSRSMAARDCSERSRIGLAREIIGSKILPSLNGNRLGIVSYAGKAAPQAYLTYEIDTIAWLAANELEISSAPGQGSAMGDAFELAFRFFDVDSDSKRQKMVILICDGGTDDNTNLEAIADGCRQRSIELTILGTGGMAPALIPVEELSAYDRMMASGRFYETGGKPASSSLDLKSLGQLNAHCQPDSRLTQVRAGFDFQLESLVSKRTYIKKPGNREIFFYPCLIFFVSLCIAALSIGRRKNNSFQENLR